MAKYFYLCDGRGCRKNCAENGFEYCKHTENENHAKNKIRRERKFEKMQTAMFEVDK